MASTSSLPDENINIDRLQKFLDEDMPITQIAQDFNVCTKTIYRRMKSFGITRIPFSDINDDDLVDIVIEIKQNHPNDGEALLDGHLKARTPPIKIQRWRLRAAIHFVDSAGVQARRTVTIKRRQYSVPCPHYLWHIDGNHKLIKWKMVIHGGIDGFTRLVVFMNISNNNKATTVHRGFIAATEQFNWPIRLRTDFGGENELIWQAILDKRGPRSALVGSSVHNQPIEQLWGIINDRVTLPFKVLFDSMARDGLLNTDNDTDIMCLHWVFLPLIQANLTREVLALNKRKISTEHQRSPCQLEIQFMHLKAAYENKPIEQHEGVVCSYQDPDDLARPLQHVRCDEFERFPAELREELCALGTALEIRDGRRLYLEVVSTIEKYLLRT
ncbi:uncharacterized protein [Mytilus edulis]|uniref:Integrase catalytic domain-containing protein n=2 Tax=Mytilus TaxID=6548 RepID=A0A8B6BR75_MYTGA|nr:unnamed protein product [Mytilus edulis]VDH93821.1 Hypothetical predicted protein [Mytilus galloprovincialis]